MGKLLLVSSLVIGIAIGIRFSLTTTQANQLIVGILKSLYFIWSRLYSRLCHLDTAYTSAGTFDAIDSNSDIDPHTGLPNCLRYPFRTEQLKKMGYLSLLGYVFEVPTDDPVFGVNGSYAHFAGHEGTYHFLGEQEPSRYALDGVETPVLADLLRWIHLLSARYKCIGHLPGIYFDPMGDPTTYMQSIMKAWDQLIRDQSALLSAYPKCERMESTSGVVFVICPAVIGPNGERVPRSPRLLVESSRRDARCACVSLGSVDRHPHLLDYPHCDPTATQCQVHTN